MVPIAESTSSSFVVGDLLKQSKNTDQSPIVITKSFLVVTAMFKHIPHRETIVNTE